MKRFIAILLSVIMLFTLGVAAFAEGETEEPAGMPSDHPKTANKIVFSIENTYIEASKEYSLPIVMKSDYLANVPEDAETFYFGFSGICFTKNLADLSDEEAMNDFVTIKGIRFSDAVAESDRIAMNQLTEFDDGSFAFKVNKADFAKFFSTSDEGIVIGYVDIATNEYVPEKYDVNFGTLSLQPYYELYTEDENGEPNGAVADPNAASYSVGYTDAEGVFTGLDLYESPTDPIAYDYAFLYHSPYVPTWQERLTTWAKAQGHLFLSFFITIFEFLDSLLTK